MHRIHAYQLSIQPSVKRAHIYVIQKSVFSQVLDSEKELESGGGLCKAVQNSAAIL